ncbi:MAG: hypothetical protein A4E53_00281 [Pelotomaculum sp. PtaB.Bin104]|nr:MAG: hypothetical protein A4E53_00281 [Pelotomaculum sp. PtaB.Bin104]
MSGNKVKLTEVIEINPKLIKNSLDDTMEVSFIFQVPGPKPSPLGEKLLALTLLRGRCNIHP